jgi:uncharacterized membrane protein YfcA
MGIAPVSDLATIVTIIMPINNGVALRGHWHQKDWAMARVVMLAIVPTSIAGAMLLDHLSGTAASLLKFLLGAVIIYGARDFCAAKPGAASSLQSSKLLLVWLFRGD